MVKPGTGRLAASIERDTDGLSLSVGFDRRYGALWRGARIRREHPGAVDRGQEREGARLSRSAARWFSPSASMHPAFTLPAHSFLRSALAELAPDILAGIDAAVAEAVSP